MTITKGSTSGPKIYSANWVETYTITYAVVEGTTFTETNPNTYDVEKETFTLNNPSKAGYRFQKRIESIEYIQKLNSYFEQKYIL